MTIITRYIESIELDTDTYLVVNFLSGDALLVSKEELDSLLTLKTENDLFDFWKDRGYIFQDKQEEEKEKERIVLLAKKVKVMETAASFTIMPTYACNCRCSYCYEGEVTQKNQTLTLPLVDSIFDHINRLADNPEEPIYLTLYGGEPLLESNMSLLEYILENANKRKSRISIITNGVSLGNYIDLLKKHEGIINLIQTTIDGPKRIHDKVRKLRNGAGTFDTIVDNIKLLLERKMNIGILVRTNVSNTTRREDIEELYNEYKKRGFLQSKYFDFYLAPIKVSYGGCQASNCIYNLHEFILKFKPFLSQLVSEGRIMNLNAWQQGLLKRIAKHGVLGPPAIIRCGATSPRSYVFGPEGDLFACWDEVGNESKRIGTWFPNWILNDYGSEWRNRVFTSIPECMECKYAFICSGGCGSYAQTKSGSLSSPACNSPSEEKAVLHELAKILTPMFLRES